MNKLSFEYVSSFINAHHFLNIHNIAKLSKEEINHIGKLYDADFYKEYKKNLFWKWYRKNAKYTESYIRKVMHLKNRLGIDFEVTDYDYLDELWQRQFTSFRSFKTIEVPFETTNTNLKPIAYFNYKNIRVYNFDKKDTWLKKQYQGELFIASKQLIFYNREENKIIQIVQLSDISAIKYHNYSLEIVIRWGKPLHLRYYANGIIYISLKRFWRKSNIAFSKDEQFNLEFNFDQLLELLFRLD